VFHKIDAIQSSLECNANVTRCTLSKDEETRLNEKLAKTLLRPVSVETEAFHGFLFHRDALLKTHFVPQLFAGSDTSNIARFCDQALHQRLQL
jgi:hypothetical protein